VLRRGTQHQVGILAERDVVALAVHLRRRGDHDELLLLVRVLEHDFGAVHVGLDRVDRLLDDQFHADRGREMEHDIAAIDELGEQRFVLHRVDEVLEAVAALEMGDVVERSGREVVEDEDMMSLIEKRVGKMGTDEAGSAGD
jgi:hypothetical protein